MSIPSSKRAAATQRYYDAMSSARKKIVAPLVILTLVVFFLQQVLTNFTSAMDGFLGRGVTVAFAYAWFVFVFAVAVTMFYKRTMDKVEAEYLPAFLEDSAAEQYEDWRDWEQKQGELEKEEEFRDELQEKALADEIRRAHGKETEQ